MARPHVPHCCGEPMEQVGVDEDLLRPIYVCLTDDTHTTLGDDGGELSFG